MLKTCYKLPEYYLILLALLAGYSPPYYVNPIFIGIVILLIFQIIFKNKVLGKILGVLFFLVNLYFLGALLSELNEFTVFNNSAKKLLVVGLTIWCVNCMFSIIMIYNYFTNNLKQSLSVAIKKINF